LKSTIIKESTQINIVRRTRCHLKYVYINFLLLDNLLTGSIRIQSYMLITHTHKPPFQCYARIQHSTITLRISKGKKRKKGYIYHTSVKKYWNTGAKIKDEPNKESWYQWFVAYLSLHSGYHTPCDTCTCNGITYTWQKTNYIIVWNSTCFYV